MSLIQTIVVKPSTHFDTIAAAALASGLAMVHADPGSEPWISWLGGSFTKSVRRVKSPIELERVRGLGLASPGSAEVTAGDAVALAFAPARYEDSPREISRLQVSGLDLAHNDVVRFRMPGAFTPHIEINADVSMSTGKTAAQVAHALGAWLLAQPRSTRIAWASAPGLDIGEVSFADYAAQGHDDASIITVVDHGLTEIPPGTATVRAYLGLLV